MSVWPFFDLSVRTPRLELRGATDALLDVALAVRLSQGIARSGEEPIDGDASIYLPSPQHERRFLTGHWGARAKTSPEFWFLPFAVVVNDAVVGMQEMVATEFPTLRTVNTASWVGLEYQAKGSARRCAPRSCTSPSPASTLSAPRATRLPTTVDLWASPNHSDTRPTAR